LDMSKITISDLEVWYKVGVPDEERAQPQKLLLTVELELDFSQAAATDDLSHTINYYNVAQHLLAFGSGRTWKLIEKLATDIAEDLRTRFRPARICVEVKQFIITEAEYISVTASR